MKRPPIEEPTAIRLLSPARTTREAIGSEGNFMPMVLFAPRNGPAAMAMIESDGDLPEALAELLKEMRATLGPPKWISVTTDAYAKPMPDPSQVEPGQLAKAFADGDPTITEQMVVALKRRGKPIEVAAQVYRYSVPDGWEWDAPETIDQTMGGISKVLEHYM